MNGEEIQNKLTDLAFERTTPFCYSCYQDCPDGQCEICGSDDLMRHFKGVGVEYGLCRYQHNPYYADNKVMLILFSNGINSNFALRFLCN